MSSSDLRRIRPAGPGDHAAYVRLFPELGVHDPALVPERFATELVPTMLVAEAGGGPDPRFVVGYAYFQIMSEMAYVRHVITAPEARRSGVARALLSAVAGRAREAGCSSWCLNVKPDNVAAIALYEKLGMRRSYVARALSLPWATVEAAKRVHDPCFAARHIEPSEDARVEAATELVRGQLAGARDAGRVLMGLFGTDGGVGGAAVYDPAFPNAYPFRAATPDLAWLLLAALLPLRRPEHSAVQVIVEGQPEVGSALVAAGATVKLEIQHMKGPLPEG